MTHLLRDQFLHYDKQSSGIISKDIFTSTLQRFGLKDKGIKRISSKFQSDSFHIDYKAFLNYFDEHQRNRNLNQSQQSATQETRKNVDDSTVHLIKTTNNVSYSQTQAQSIPFNPPPENISHQRRIERDIVGNHEPMNNSSKLYLLKDKIEHALQFSDPNRTGFVTKSQFKSSLKQSGLTQDKTIKLLAKTFANDKKQIDYHSFLSLINPNSKVLDSFDENKSTKEPFLVNNHGNGVAGKKKHFETMKLDHIGLLLKDQSFNEKMNKKVQNSKSENNWISSVANHTSGMYSQIFEEFFKYDPVFTGYVDKESFSTTLQNLNIASKDVVQNIIKDVGDPVLDKIDYNKFIQYVIEERRGHAEGPLTSRIEKNFDTKGGVKAIDGGSKYFEQVFKSQVLNNELENISDASLNSVSGARKRKLSVSDHVGQIFKENLNSNDQRNSSPQQKNNVKEEETIHNLKSKLYQQNSNFTKVYRTFVDDQSGNISYKNFKKVLNNNYGFSFKDEDLKPIFSKMNPNNLDEVTFDQFSKYFTGNHYENESKLPGINDLNKEKKQGLKSSRFSMATSTDNTVTAIPEATVLDREMNKFHRHISEKANIKSNNIHDLFRSLDTNHDGVLSTDELRSGLENFGININDQQFEQIVKVATKEINSKHLNFEQFSRLISGESEDEFVFHSHIDKSFYDRKRGLKYIESPLSKEKKFIDMKKQKYGPNQDSQLLKEDIPLLDKIETIIKDHGKKLELSFNKFDQNHEGKITREQFKRSLFKIGTSLSIDEFDRLFSYIDKNRNNSIKYSDLPTLITNLKESSIQTHESSSGNNSYLKNQTIDILRNVINEKQNQLKTITETLDNQGSLKNEEFKKFFTENLLYPIDTNLWDTVISHVDPKHSGEVSYSNFMSFINFVNNTDKSKIPTAMRNNIVDGIIGQSNVDENIVGSTPENPFFRGLKRRIPEASQDTETSSDIKEKSFKENINPTIKHNNSSNQENGKQYIVSDSSEEQIDNSTTTYSQNISPPSTPKKESKILRHSENPKKLSQDSTQDNELNQFSNITKTNTTLTKPKIYDIRTINGRPISFKQLDQVCTALDNEGNGKISQQKFFTALKNLGIDIESGNVKDIANACSKDNSLDYKKFQFVASGLSPLPTKEALNNQSSNVSNNKSNSIQFDNLKKTISKKLNEKNKNLTTAFLAADVERKGYITGKQFQEALHKYQIHIPDESIETITNSIASKDGSISIKQFIDFIKPTGFWEENNQQSLIEKHNQKTQINESNAHSNIVESNEEFGNFANKLIEKKGNRTNAFLSLKSEDGYIHIDNLGSKLHQIGLQLSDKEKHALTTEFNENGSRVDYATFSQLLDKHTTRSLTPTRDHLTTLNKTIKKELIDATQNKILRLHEAFKALDYKKEKSLDPQRFKQAIKVAATNVPDWIIDRSIQMSIKPDGSCNYESFLNEIGVSVPEYNKFAHTNEVQSPRINIQHQHHIPTGDKIFPNIDPTQFTQSRSISPRRGVFYPSDSGDIIGHRGPVREASNMFQTKSRLSQNKDELGSILKQTPFKEPQSSTISQKQMKDIQQRMNLSPRERMSRYAYSPLSRGNPLTYVEFGENPPNNAYVDKIHPDERRRKRVIEIKPCTTEQKLLHNSKARVSTPNKDNRENEVIRTELKHKGYESTKSDSVEKIFKNELIKEKPVGIKINIPNSHSISNVIDVKKLLNLNPVSDPTTSNIHSIREQVNSALSNKYSSSTVAFRHLSKNGNSISIPNLQEHLSSTANLHISKKDLKEAYFGGKDIVHFNDFAQQLQGGVGSSSDRSQSAPPSRPSSAVPHKNFSHDIISYRY